LPSPDGRELALLLVSKAEGDESILDKLLGDPDVPDDVLGFHAQQAIEKRLKAVLASRGIDFERTHSIGYLTALLEHHGIDLPERREQIEELTPWAVADGTRTASMKCSIVPPCGSCCRFCASGRDACWPTRREAFEALTAPRDGRSTGAICA
jgi:hypothetical protein